MKKYKVRMISAVLAFCMLLSGTVSVFAAEPTYTAKYDWKATKEVYSTIIADADQLLSDAAFNGNTVQEIWRLMPQINELLSGLGVDLGSGTAQFYVDIDSEFFGNLPQFMEENSYDTVNSDVLTAYFAENPIVIDSDEEFRSALNTCIDTISSGGFWMVLYLVIGIGLNSDLAEMEEFANTFDVFSELLGVNQGVRFYDAALNNPNNLPAEEIAPINAANMADYIENILSALIPNTVDHFISLVQRLMIPENSAKLFNAVETLLDKLDMILTTLTPVIGALGITIDLTGVQETVSKINGYIGKVPLNDDGSIEWNGAVEYIVNDVVLPELAGMDLDIIGFGDTTSAIVKLDELNPANLASAADGFRQNRPNKQILP